MTSANPIHVSLEAPWKDENGIHIPRVQDITLEDEVVYEPRRTPAENLGGRLRRVILERGLEFFETLDVDLLEHEADKMEVEDDQEKEDKDSVDGDEDGPQAQTVPDKKKIMTRTELVKMREELMPKLMQAQHEMAVSRDLIACMLATAIPSIPQPLPPELASMVTGSFSSSNISKLPPLNSVRAFDAQLTIGGKDESIRKASRLFQDAAESAERALEKGELYWKYALEARAGNWTLLPASLSNVPLAKLADKTARDIIIHYGMEESAPALRRRSCAAINYHDADNTLPVAFPSRRQYLSLRVSLVRQNPDGSVTITKVSRSPEESESLDRLLDEAQQEILEQEIFLELIRDAGMLPSSANRVSEKRIAIDVSPGLELRFELVDQDVEEPGPPPDPDSQLHLTTALIHASLPLQLLRLHSYIRTIRLSPPASRTAIPPRPPVLQDIYNLFQYQSFCDRVEEQMNGMVMSLKQAGVQVHLRFVRLGEAAEELVSLFLQGREIALDVRHGRSRASGEALLRIDNRRSLRLTLQPPSGLVAHLPQSTLTISSVPQLRQLLIDEVRQYILGRIRELGEAVCAGQEKMSWFADGAAGKCVGTWSGVVLHFKLYFDQNFRINGEAVTVSKSLSNPKIDKYPPTDGDMPLFDWAKSRIEQVTQ